MYVYIFLCRPGVYFQVCGKSKGIVLVQEILQFMHSVFIICILYKLLEVLLYYQVLTLFCTFLLVRAQGDDRLYLEIYCFYHLHTRQTLFSSFLSFVFTFLINNHLCTYPCNLFLFLLYLFSFNLTKFKF